MANKLKRILIVGTGRMGQIRMRASRIVPGIQLCGIVDENIENAKKYGEQYQIPYAADIQSFIKVKTLYHQYIHVIHYSYTKIE